jgi:hypothetical protein
VYTLVHGSSPTRASHAIQARAFSDLSCVASSWHVRCNHASTSLLMQHAKERREMETINLPDTAAWRFQVIAAFVIALGLTTGGILYLPVSAWIKGYLLMGVYFTVSSAFGLAKSLRDAHESHRLVNKISEAKTEKILRDLAHA